MKRIPLKIIVSISILPFCILSSYGQQRPQYTQYMVNNYLFNPAVTGINDNISVKAGYRTQWVGFDDAPKTYFLSIHGPVNKIDDRFIRKKVHHQGIGGYIFNDVTGPTSRTGLYLSYAYHLSLTKKVKFSMGAFAGLLQTKVDADKITLTNPNDNAVLFGIQSRFLPDISFGIWIYTDKTFFGVSMSQVIQNRIFESPETTIAAFSKLNNHYFLHGGYNFRLNRDWSLVPSVLLKAVKPTYSHFDINLKVKYKANAWAGLSYRDDDAIAAMIGFASMKSGFNLSYSYDLTTSKIRLHSAGSHEIVVGYNFPSKGKVLCPEDFW